jgi:hypothetical protein
MNDAPIVLKSFLALKGRNLLAPRERRFFSPEGAQLFD